MSETFLSTIAQVSATFIGFSFLVPVAQAISSGSFFESGNAIKPKALLKKSLVVVSLPISVLLCPLVSSLLLIADNLNLPSYTYHYVVLIVLSLISIIIFIMAKMYSRMKSQHLGFQFIFEYLPFAVVSWYIFMLVNMLIGFLHGIGGTSQFKWTTLGLVIAGLLFLFRNLAITYEKGLKFKLDEIDENFLKETEELKNKIERALNERRQQIERLEKISDALCHNAEKRQEFIKCQGSIAWHKADIWRWEGILGKQLPEHENKFKKLEKKLKKQEITLCDSADYKRRKEKWEDNLAAFEQETKKLKEEIDRIYGEKENRSK